MIDVLDLCEAWPDPTVLCRADNPDATRSGIAQEFADTGYVIAPGLVADVVDDYCTQFARVHPERALGWQYPTPYMDNEFVRDLSCDKRIADLAETLIGEPMGVHLNLSNWRSTQRNWHQDGYLNPDSNLDWYIAAWIALDDIHPDAGPFEFVPGSHHTFNVIRHTRMLGALTPEERRSPEWPTYSERILTPYFVDAIAKYELPVERFLARKGDVLFWHSRLLHRGSTPRNPTLERRALIVHLSGIHHRPDMPPARPHGGGWFFPL